MHPEAFEYVRAQVLRHGPFARVAEIGSRQLNGSVRELFGDAAYTGIDLYDGPGVDIVADAASLAEVVWKLNGSPAQGPDCVVCTEVLEHAPNAADLCAAAYRWLEPNGVLILTAACDPRAPHSAICDGPLQPDEFYRNVRVDELREWLRPFASGEIDLLPRGDIRAVAVK